MDGTTGKVLHPSLTNKRFRQNQFTCLSFSSSSLSSPLLALLICSTHLKRKRSVQRLELPFSTHQHHKTCMISSTGSITSLHHLATPDFSGHALGQLDKFPALCHILSWKIGWHLSLCIPWRMWDLAQCTSQHLSDLQEGPPAWCNRQLYCCIPEIIHEGKNLKMSTHQSHVTYLEVKKANLKFSNWQQQKSKKQL